MTVRRGAYVIAQPPIRSDVEEMTQRDWEEYYEWFMAAVPDRIQQLERAVTSTAGFSSWRADLTTDSLFRLGEWFENTVSVRERRLEEVDAIYANAPRWFQHVSVSDRELTNESLSYALDIGMYFGQVLLHQHPTILRWCLKTGSALDVDFGHPVIEGFRGPALNPVRIAVTFAHGLAKQTKRGGRLRELYDYWSSRA